MKGIGTPYLADEDLPGGAKQLLVAARKAGGWFCWTAGGTIVKGKKGEGGVEQVEVGRCLVKGRHGDGRAWVVRYVEGKVDVAYHLTHHHSVYLPGLEKMNEKGKMVEVEKGEVYRWTTEKPTLEKVSITELKKYMGSLKDGGTPW